MRKLAAWGLGAWVSLTVAPAAAQTAEPAAEDVQRLLREIDQEETALAGADCPTACRALDAIRRITDRVCELDPGPPCERSRKKLEDAGRRVDRRCGPCAPERKTSEPDEGDDAAAPGQDAPVAATAPAERGGCAACTMGAAPTEPSLWLALLAVLSAAGRRRRAGRAAPAARA